ncbi:oleate hydratase [Kitasatospora sp. NPDC088346]|uniref:oleate hydratase n=1 Tax=Kitasatospora sp. NPDC088346 TaxID=3364073 RepID=UPI003829AE6D
MIDSARESKAYLVGGGIAALAAAAFLVRDGDFPGENIHILEELPLAGGSLDGRGNVGGAYVARGGRMLEDEAYTCLWDLLDTVPALEREGLSVRQEILDFNEEIPTAARARLVDREHRIVDASRLGLDAHDRVELARLLATPESVIGARRIDEFFSEHFFATNFWAMWRTTFAFQNRHSAIELKRYFLRFAQEFPRIHTLSGVRRTRLDQYDSIVRPLTAWLAGHGVRIEHGVKVTDVDFTEADGIRRARRLHLERGGRRETVELDELDLAFITLGSMTADASYGGDDTVPELVRDKRDGGWALWETLSRKAPDFGRPDVFNGDLAGSAWESFTLTMRSPALLERIERFTGNAPGTGALMTFKDSPWLLSVVVPHQPHFSGQPEDVFTLWGYGLFIDVPGDHTDTTMAGSTGREILDELLGQLGFDDIAAEVRATSTVTTVLMPYITSQFAPRAPGDRPRVIPHGARNFAFLGQFVEIPQDVVFTVEYSVRGAMHAVHELLGLDIPVPPVHHALSDPRTALRALKASFA